MQDVLVAMWSHMGAELGDAAGLSAGREVGAAGGLLVGEAVGRTRTSSMAGQCRSYVL